MVELRNGKMLVFIMSPSVFLQVTGDKKSFIKSWDFYRKQIMLKISLKYCHYGITFSTNKPALLKVIQIRISYIIKISSLLVIINENIDLDWCGTWCKPSGIFTTHLRFDCFFNHINFIFLGNYVCCCLERLML